MSDPTEVSEVDVSNPAGWERSEVRTGARNGVETHHHGVLTPDGAVEV